uniref:Putative secreted peptide n=1 Tax=Anopheles braziliensis TaxID=58242 RepID=A0A2M3ZTB9_9DIPT
MVVLLVVVVVVVMMVVVVGEVKLNSLIASDTIRCSARYRDHLDRLRSSWCCCCRSPKSSIPCPAAGGVGGGGGSGSDLCFMLHRTQPPAAGA